MRPFSAAMWKHVQIKHGNICFGEHKPSAICPLTADCAEWDEFPPNIIHNLCNLTSTIPRLKISQHGHKKDEINDRGRIDELMDVKGRRRGHKMKKIWMRQRQSLSLSLSLIYIYIASYCYCPKVIPYTWSMRQPSLTHKHTHTHTHTYSGLYHSSGKMSSMWSIFLLPYTPLHQLEQRSVLLFSCIDLLLFPVYGGLLFV